MYISSTHDEVSAPLLVKMKQAHHLHYYTLSHAIQCEAFAKEQGDTMQALKLYLNMSDRIKYQSQRHGLENPFDLKILDYSQVFKQNENGVEVIYPEMLGLKLEGWNNTFFSLRVEDCRFIPEGCNLDGPGLTAYQIYRRMLQEMKSYAAFIKRNNLEANTGGN